MARVRRGLAGCAIAWAWTLPASAQPVDVEQHAPAAVVEEEAPAEAPDDPTAFTRVIEVDDYEGEDKQLEAVLESTPGVFVRRFGGLGERSEVSIRGSTGSQVVVQLDGVRLNSAQTGGVDLSSVPLGLLERVEVSRGGGSVQAGSDAIGGVVNLVTRGASARPETRVAFGAGPFETWTGAASQTGKLGPLETLVGYDYFKTSGDWDFETLATPDPDDNESVERINNRTERHSGLLKLAADVGDRTRVELLDQLYHVDQGEPGLDQALGGQRRFQSPVGNRRRTRNVVQLRALHVRGPVEGELRGFHRFDRNRFRDTFRGQEFDTYDRNHSYGGRGNLSLDADWGPIGQRLSVGAELRGDAYDSRGSRARFRTVLGLFLQDEISLLDDRVVLVPAVRFDETDGFGSEWIPRVGLQLRPLDWLEIRANAERSYRVPNFDELFLDERTLRGDPGLRPEDADNLDAGLRLRLPDWGPLRGGAIEAAYFYNDIANTIVFQNVSQQVVVATNIPDARLQGVEVAASLALGPWAELSASWTHLDTELRSNGTVLPGRPDNELDARLVLRALDGRVKLVGELQYTDEIPANQGPTLILGDRVTYDASATIALGRFFSLAERTGLSGLRLSVIATNFTDRAVRDALFFPQPGRTVSVRIEAWR